MLKYDSDCQKLIDAGKSAKIGRSCHKEGGRTASERIINAGDSPKQRCERKDGGDVGGDWMSKAVKRPGALHRATNTPMGEKIPQRKIDKAEHSKSPRLREQAQFAETARKIRMKKDK